MKVTKLVGMSVHLGASRRAFSALKGSVLGVSLYLQMSTIPICQELIHQEQGINRRGNNLNNQKQMEKENPAIT